MATKKITDLTSLSAADAASSDVLPIVDIDADVTKKITLTSIKSGSFSGSFQGGGSGLTGVVSASYAITASYAQNAGGSSFTAAGISGSWQGATGSMSVLSASYATTASYVLNAVSASYAASASYEITKEVSSSYADVAGGLTEQPSISVTNITASGDISASSVSSISTHTFESNGVHVASLYSGFSGNILQIGNNNGQPIEIGKGTTDPLKVNGNLTASANMQIVGAIHTVTNITASSNISSSGVIKSISSSFGHIKSPSAGNTTFTLQSPKATFRQLDEGAVRIFPDGAATTAHGTGAYSLRTSGSQEHRLMCNNAGSNKQQKFTIKGHLSDGEAIDQPDFQMFQVEGDAGGGSMNIHLGDRTSAFVTGSNYIYAAGTLMLGSSTETWGAVRGHLVPTTTTQRIGWSQDNFTSGASNPWKSLWVSEISASIISSSGTIIADTGSFSHLKGNSPLTIQAQTTFQQPITASGTISSSAKILAKSIELEPSYDPFGGLEGFAGSISASAIQIRPATMDVNRSFKISQPAVYQLLFSANNGSGDTLLLNNSSKKITMYGELSGSSTSNIVIGGGLTTTHITASGNISASDTSVISGHSFQSNGAEVASLHGSGILQIANNNGTPIEVGKSTTDPFKVKGNITASANMQIVGSVHAVTSITASGGISSSGIITADTGSFSYLKGNSPITIGNELILQGGITLSPIQSAAATDAAFYSINGKRGEVRSQLQGGVAADTGWTLQLRNTAISASSLIVTNVIGGEGGIVTGSVVTTNVVSAQTASMNFWNCGVAIADNAKFTASFAIM